MRSSIALATWIAALSATVSAATVTGVAPADGARDVCPDTLLCVTFDQPPVLTGTNRILIFSSNGDLADTIDLSQNDARHAQQRIIGTLPFNTVPVMIFGNKAVIYPHCRAIKFGQTARVTIEAGVFAGMTTATTWSFQIKAASPGTDVARITVAADGSGDFCTVQGAVDFVPDGNTQARTIFIRNGTYEEIVYVSGKHNLTFLGENRKKTIIEYANNELFNPRGQGRHTLRQTFGVDANDCTVRNLTFHNTTHQGGSQAEALRIDGQRCVVDGDDFYSFQDTLRLSGTVFIRDCHIEGDVDFIWGTGACFFTNCEIKAMTSGACITQVRNTNRNNGDVFVDCRLTRAPGVTNVRLSRVDAVLYPYSHVAWVNCSIDPGMLRSDAWQTSRDTTNTAVTLRYWEYNLTDLTGTNVLDPSHWGAYSRQISAEEAAQMRDAKTVLGGWQP